MELLDKFNELVNTLQKYELYQTDDEVDLALTDLKSAINETRDMKILKGLRTYLSGDDADIMEAWDKIKTTPNQQCIIDYIDGVQTAEAFEYNFTCVEFIELIEP